MTTSPEALREAVERVASSVAAAKWPNLKGCDVYPEDLTLVLSALQEARGALGPFALAQPSLDDPADAWGPDMLFLSELGHDGTLVNLTASDFRRAAEVYRALSPGGAEQ